MRTITLRQLEVFCETAAAGHLTRAAQKLHMTQSAASMALRQFEKDAGGPVFTRLGRGLKLNDRGLRILPLAGAALEHYDRFVESCRDGGSLSGPVRVGASTTVANYCLPGRMRDFMAQNPLVEVSLRVGNTDDIASALRRGEIDFAIVEGKVSDEDISVKPWLRDELLVIMPPTHCLAAKKKVRLRSLVHERWVLREKGSGTLSTLESVLAEQGARLLRVREIGHTEAIKRAVEAGMGLGCLSALAVSREVQAGSLAALKIDPPLLRRFCLLEFKGRYQNRQSKALLQSFLKAKQCTP